MLKHYNCRYKENRPKNMFGSHCLVLGQMHGPEYWYNKSDKVLLLRMQLKQTGTGHVL